MSVHLTPNNALGFNRPFTQLVKRFLTVTNNNAQPIAFKVKTTAPKLYCVRPNSGRIEPGESVDVSVMLQPMKEEPPLSLKCKDKFLIQSTLITPEKETKGLQDIWNVTDATEEWKVYQQKLRVVFLPPEGQTVEEEDETQLHQIHQIANLSQGDSQRYDTVRQHPSNGHVVEPTPQYSFDEDRMPSQSEPERPRTPPAVDYTVAREESQESQPYERSNSGGVGVVNVNVHSASPPPSPPTAPAPQVDPELEARFAAAQAEIQRLRSLLAAVPDPSSIAPESTVAPTELRRRYTSALSDDGSTYAGTDTGTMVDEPIIHQEGVPLQVVIIVALGVFITTYLFF
ncbi:hypothetical protein SERLA73DRAFT_183174 [Serpula lacrymans var. lacrymans S7.3]|uniref:MSP domain-containing protein n=2 Tax=Serpula lacrymans var. lacrymans TaxID=341189 RepID=F8Q1R5_SERL3|nr:uncharacterized protein SERLADRAFT_470195 [Serpula lacrymans var. lacrymans S7.9]EGN98243.1 hypothetical protein SERLA73DRAFT_183174 [Serpula lacrymans var. lacrymans S7.3]EGO23815.1 hypothetical protein SERLADRAFT_470195 [Serpula lacrymans var. lacrymans S7.9]